MNFDSPAGSEFNELHATGPTQQSIYVDLDPYGPLGLSDPPPDPANTPSLPSQPSGNARRRRRQRDGEGDCPEDLPAEAQEKRDAFSMGDHKDELVRMHYSIKVEAEMELRANMKDDVNIRLLCVPSLYTIGLIGLIIGQHEANVRLPANSVQKAPKRARVPSPSPAPTPASQLARAVSIPLPPSPSPADGTRLMLPPAEASEAANAPTIGINAAGVADVLDVCYIQVAKLSFEQGFFDQKVSRSVTMGVLLFAVGLGMIIGWVCGWVTAREKYDLPGR